MSKHDLVQCPFCTNGIVFTQECCGRGNGSYYPECCGDPITEELICETCHGTAKISAEYAMVLKLRGDWCEDSVLDFL